MGMMNNAIYGVHVTTTTTTPEGVSASSSTGNHAGGCGRCLRFTHPTSPGPEDGGGWMETAQHRKLQQQQQAPRHGNIAAVSTVSKPSDRPAWARLKAGADAVEAAQTLQSTSLEDRSRTISLKELSSHASEAAGVWVAISGGVYDVSSFMRDHPGGPASLLAAAGKDVTSLFCSIHGEEAGEWSSTWIHVAARLKRLFY